MAIQPFETYHRVSRVGLDRASHTRIVERLFDPLRAVNHNYPTKNQVIFIGSHVGAEISSEIVDLYELLRLDSEGLFGPGDEQLPVCSDEILVHEAFAFHTDFGGMEKMRVYYNILFGQNI